MGHLLAELAARDRVRDSESEARRRDLDAAASARAEDLHRSIRDRDATLTAIALEIHHRRTNSYPASLTELVPALLPAVPTDFWDGKPIKYKLDGGKPLLYTVGCDKTDNGGARTDDSSVVNSRPELLRPEFKDKDWIYIPHIRKAPKVDPVPVPRTPP
jgi:hypothetical protein